MTPAGVSRKCGPWFLLLILCCSNRASWGMKLNLTATCAESQVYFCTLTNITATVDDPLTVVNASAIQLSELVLRNSVIGRIPNEVFKQAPNLKTFLMHNCALNRLSSYDFERAFALRKLVLQKNRFSFLPQKVFSAAFALEELLLGNNMIHVIYYSAFSGLANLKYLDLQQNNIERLPDALFTDLINLEHIDLSNNEIEQIDIHTFATNAKLQTLLLNDNKFTLFEPDALLHLTRLHLLDLSGCALDELNVQSVDMLLVQNSFLKHCVIDGSVVKLHAGNNLLTTLAIGDKRAVRELDLHGNLFETLDDFVDMVNLKRLDLSKNQIRSLSTSRSPLYLPLPSLAHLNLASNQLQNLSANHFLLLQKLTHLDLAFNHLLRLQERIFEPLVDLEKFYIEGNRLHEFDFPKFQQSHSHLKEIGMFDNEWEFLYMKKVVTYLKEHNIQLPVRFPTGTSVGFRDASALVTFPISTAPTSHPHHTGMSNNYANSDDIELPPDDIQARGENIEGIHPYWTLRDILALVTLVVVLMILLIQMFYILHEEGCLVYCCSGRSRNDERADRQRLEENDSEV